MGGVSVDGGLNSNEADRSEDMEPVRGEWQEMEPVRGEWPRKAADMGARVLGHASSGAAVAARGPRRGRHGQVMRSVFVWVCGP